MSNSIFLFISNPMKLSKFTFLEIQQAHHWAAVAFFVFQNHVCFPARNQKQQQKRLTNIGHGLTFIPHAINNKVTHIHPQSPPGSVEHIGWLSMFNVSKWCDAFLISHDNAHVTAVDNSHKCLMQETSLTRQQSWRSPLERSFWHWLSSVTNIRTFVFSSNLC